MTDRDEEQRTLVVSRAGRDAGARPRSGRRPGWLAMRGIAAVGFAVALGCQPTATVPAAVAAGPACAQPCPSGSSCTVRTTCDPATCAELSGTCETVVEGGVSGTYCTFVCTSTDQCWKEHEMPGTECRALTGAVGAKKGCLAKKP